MLVPRERLKRGDLIVDTLAPYPGYQAKIVTYSPRWRENVQSQYRESFLGLVIADDAPMRSINKGHQYVIRWDDGTINRASHSLIFFESIKQVYRVKE